MSVRRNQMFVKVDGGLTKPFYTTTGFKQGCVFSPMLFNSYINKLPIMMQIVILFMWVMILSTVWPANKMTSHFTELGLQVNTKKTKCKVFQSRRLQSLEVPKTEVLHKWSVIGEYWPIYLPRPSIWTLWLSWHSFLPKPTGLTFHWAGLCQRVNNFLRCVSSKS